MTRAKKLKKIKVKAKKLQPPLEQLYVYSYFVSRDEIYLANKGLMEDVVRGRVEILKNIMNLENLQGVFISKKLVDDYKDYHFPEKKQKKIAEKYQGRFYSLEERL